MSTPGSGSPAGWYDDPADPTLARYWDGEEWTSRVQSRDLFTVDPSDDAPPSNYLIPAILTTIFCCIPMGVAAIMKAAQVNKLWSTGRTEEAFAASAQAKRFAWIAFGLGVVAVVVFVAAGGFEIGGTNGSDF